MTRWLWFSIVLTLAAFALAGYVYGFQYDRLPEKVPIHWNIRGEADDWVSRERSIWIFLLTPGIMTLFLALTVALPWLSPKGYDLDRFKETYGYVMAILQALFAYIQMFVIVGGMKLVEFDLGRWLVAGMFLFFALLGNVMGKVRKNFWVGVRTPWTLASERVWNETHRLCAWLMVGGGLIGFLVTAAGLRLEIVIVLMMAMFLVPVVYSLVLYKRLERQGKLESQVQT